MQQARDPDSQFRRSLAQVNRLIERDSSLSGHERNCAFLNTRGQRFATISAVSGFDFPDDGRGMALVDWDHDGDVDVWVTNRTAPRLRFLRNDTRSEHHFLVLQLKGTTCNRDAIGSRVEVQLRDRPGEILIKTLRAGEGFLSQSSKSLHFGLGTATEIERVVIRWPDGQQERFSNLAADRRYLLVQGSGIARPLAAARAALAIVPGEQPVAVPSQQARIPLTARLPVPRLPFRSLDTNTPEAIDVSGDRALLVTTWATWCAPCLTELRDLSTQASRLRSAGLDVVSICVDSSLGATDLEQRAKTILRELDFPFPAGVANGEFVQRIRTVHDLSTGVPVPMPVPSSFLLDRQGRLAVIYRGPVDVEQLLQDVEQLAQEDAAWQRYAAPFPGRWNERSARSDVLRIARELLDREQIADALYFVDRHDAALQSSSEYPKLLVWLGDSLVAQGSTAEGVRQYRRALQMDPDHLIAMNNYAWQLATHPDQQVRDGTLAVRWAARAAELTAFGDSGILDTLAASHAEAEQFAQAVAIGQKALQLAQAEGDPARVRRLQQRLRMYQQGKPFRAR